MAPADNVPNFDSMSPEEIMAWMESLAKRQGANSAEFTTEANLEIPEIDPDSVVIDEPGYVPSEGKSKGQKIVGKMPSKPAETAPPPPVEIAPPVVEAVLTPPPIEVAPPPPVEIAPPPPVAAAPIPAASENSMSWLESLAADQGAAIDLSSLSADLTPAASTPAPAANPVDWLESLAQNQADAPEPIAAAGDSDPMNWLESLAKRQGARNEELMTEANIEVPMPESWADDGPGYTDISFDAPGLSSKTAAPPQETFEATRAFEPAAAEDPAAWLDSLATGQGFEIPKPADAPAAGLSDDDISSALARGEVVPHEQMEAWMSRQLEIGADRPEPEELSGDYDPDAPAVPAELPSWFLEQVGQSGPPEEVAKPQSASQPPLIDFIQEPPAVADMPDWLRDEPEPAGELDSIFANTLDESLLDIPPMAATPAPAAAADFPIDVDDPWVEAFDQEYEQGQADISTLPDWYVNKVSEAPAAEPAGAGPVLQEANLEAETELPVGEPESVPDWLAGLSAPADETPAVPADMPDWLKAESPAETAAPAAASLAPVASDMPDWLSSIEVESSEIPDWLTETLGTATSEQIAVVAQPTPQPAVQTQAIVPARPAAVSPAPVPVQATQIDVAATLNAARSQIGANDLEGGLGNYELLIRANAQLDAVVDDLTKVVEKVKNAAVYRILGDGLMRQGKLQSALDIYRKALNQL